MNFFELDKEGQREVFDRVAQETGRRAAVLEKDLWVCWTLKQLFQGERAASLVFKGGTSLSKVYRVIDRFSEDVDVTIDKFDLGYSLKEELPSRSKIKNELTEVKANLVELIQEKYLPLLSTSSLVQVSVDPNESTQARSHGCF